MQSGETRIFDVLVAGGGNAALCAALSARREGAEVLILESAPQALRGGNSRHTRNLRHVHGAGSAHLSGAYSEEEFFEDLWRVTGGATDAALARLVIRESADLGEWVARQGARWQPALRGTLQLSRTNAFFLGGGKALLNAYYETAQRLGVELAYESEVTDLEIRGGAFHSAEVVCRGASRRVAARAVVVASGGFEANLGWLREYWGAAADHFLVRGTPYNRGRLLRVLLDRGAQPVGDPREFHALALDARAPKFDGGIATRLDSIPFGIVVNRDARRFYDEGEDVWPKRYAIWGGLIARQPEQIAYSVVDACALEHFMPSLYPPLQAGSIAELAAALGLDRGALERTVAEFNAAVQPGPFDPSRLDGCGTRGLDPPKSHWALPLRGPPFFAYPLRPGITFTYLGVAVDASARVRFQPGGPSHNVFAAGEIMAGNVLGRGYLAGIGMTIGAVFGRIAGREAARTARAAARGAGGGSAAEPRQSGGAVGRRAASSAAAEVPRARG
jgi:tricarballylate dehydrogenase